MDRDTKEFENLAPLNFKDIKEMWFQCLPENYNIDDDTPFIEEIKLRNGGHFIDRKPLLGVIVTKFNEHLETYFEKGEAVANGLTTVNYMATQLNLSPKYLSDLQKQETGKTALELIHLYVISQAKNMIVAGDQSISEIVFKLGF